MSNTFDSAFNHEVLNDSIDILTKNQFILDNNIQQQLIEIPKEKLRKANWLSSILALSPDEAHQQKALNFSTLCYLQYNNDLYLRNCYLTQSRTGNIPLSKHLNGLFNKGNFSNSFNTLLDIEMGLQRFDSIINIDNHEFVSTRFQKKLWKALQEEPSNIAISAPTSSGKSFIIQNYLINRSRKLDAFRAVYIVPSRALIYQVSASFKKNLNDEGIIVRTGFGNEETNEISKKEVIVVTPERCLKLLEVNMSNDSYTDINVIFIDEIQNIEKGSRGILLEYILKELHRRWPKAKLVTAGPYLERSENLLHELSTNSVSPQITRLSSVFQLKSVISASKQDRKLLKASVISPSGRLLEFNVKTKSSFFSKIKNNPGEALANIVSVFGSDSKNIIYSHRTDTSENWAIKISENTSSNTSQTTGERIDELIAYLSEEVHEKYSLIRCLKKGVAFHHSGLPDIARTEIEDIYSNSEDIQNLVCTSTLLEGVNLPAKKMFIIKPKAASNNLSDFDFGNLIGRAGRMSEHLYGSIYCIELDEEPWAKEKLTNDFSKEIVSATSRAMTENLDELKLGLTMNPLHIKANEGIAYTISILRHKLNQSEEELTDYLAIRKVEQTDAEMILTELKKSSASMIIPKELLALNPMIDPILQDSFFRNIQQNGIYQWLITALPFNTRDMISVQEQRGMEFKDKNFYGQFEYVTEALNHFFDIVSEANNNSSYASYTIRQIVRDAVPWIRGSSYKVLIERELENLSEEETVEKVDTAVRRITKSINKNVRFLMVKYFKLWADTLRYFMSDEEIESHKYILNLCNMIEMGTDNPRGLELISKGITRTVALALVKKIPHSYTGSLEDWIQINAKFVLPPLYVKHLKNLGYKISN
ncbi:DEAD/DEAH box helicase [Paenibacillus sp. J5C_2022]|uniref:DEAD/DEAH box helicase n=1 Tax=Paenibacillus sp. J5C2022 TaxID=2977129 RepID=UPI0021D0F922|nr:DEAD/DEAH box helicase [Paenibacillus sp. J5C2022]MCU6708007.1 DEAD/DEAH box helicase [Paenibacillus sp. J5C2022]